MTGELRHLAHALSRRGLWLALLVSLLLSATAYQLPFSYSLEMGTPEAARYITNFYPPQDAEGRAARWSHAYSYIRLAGTGGNRPLRITVDFNPSRAGATDPRPVTVHALVGGEELFSSTLPPVAAWRTMTLSLDASHAQALAARDLVIEIRTDVYRPPDYQGNELGILVSNVKIAPLPGAPWQPVVPNVRVMLFIALLVLGLYLLVGRSLQGWKTTHPGTIVTPKQRVMSLPALVATFAGLAAAVAIAWDVVWLSSAVQPAVEALFGLYVLLLVLIYVSPRVLPLLRDEWRAVGMALGYRPLLGLIAAAPVLFSFGFQAPLSYSIDIGSGHDTPFLRGFNPPMFPLPNGSPGDYRYTSARSFIEVPGVGSGNQFSVTLSLSPGAGRTASGDVRLLANGQEITRTRLKKGWQAVTFSASSGPAQLLDAANLELEIRAPAEVVEGGEQRGVLLDKVMIRQLNAAGPSTFSPAHEEGLLATMLLLYLLVARSSGRRPALPARRLGLLASGASLLVAAWGLRVARVDIALAVPHLLITLLAGYVLLVLAGRLLGRTGEGTQYGAYSVVPALFSVAFMLRYGFAALPQMNVVDLPYHLKWLQTLIGGNFLALYLPGELSKVPPEWSLNVLVPKSPLFYMAMWPLGLAHGLDLGQAVLFVVSILDALLVPVLFIMVRPVSAQGALWSAGLYAVMPLAFRAFAFGILPTIFAQALTLLVMLWPTLRPFVLRPGLRAVSPYIAWVLLLTASLIAFPTALAFNTSVLVALAIGWAWRRAAPRGAGLALVVGLVAALALSFVLYYGLYVQPFVANTLPALSSGTTVGGKVLWPGGAPEMVGWIAGYLVNWLPALLLPLGIALLWHGDRPYPRRLSVLMLTWLLVLLVGMALNLRFDLIGKHLYYTMPAMSIAGGLVLGRIWSLKHGGTYARALAILAALSVAWAALGFMAGRI